METHERLCDWRGVAVADACPGCGASGVKAYPSSATWHGGPGGQMLTQDVCDQCWGSGDLRHPWPNRREIGAKFQELAQRAASAQELEGARESVAQLTLLAADYSGRLNDAARLLEMAGDNWRKCLAQNERLIAAGEAQAQALQRRQDQSDHWEAEYLVALIAIHAAAILLDDVLFEKGCGADPRVTAWLSQPVVLTARRKGQ